MGKMKNDAQKRIILKLDCIQGAQTSAKAFNRNQSDPGC